MAYKLQDIVDEWIVENGKNESMRARLYTIALSGLRELHLDVNGVVKIVELCINDNDTVDLPNDFINYTRIGMIGGDGRVYAMARDNQINLAPNCGVQGRNLQNQGDWLNPYIGAPYSGFFYGVNGFTGGIFGAGGGSNGFGFYRLDKKTNQLWLGGLNMFSNCSIILEYIGDIDAEDGDFVVNPFVIQTIKDWISWRYCFNDRNTSASEKMYKQKIYANSLRIAKSRYGSSTPEEWATELRKTNSATVRF